MKKVIIRMLVKMLLAQQAKCYEIIEIHGIEYEISIEKYKPAADLIKKLKSHIKFT